MIQNVDVSVVIPVYNSKNTITRALDSVLKQKVLPKEIVLVDDKSTDDSVDIIIKYIERYKGSIEIRLIQLEHNSGPAKARNTGWENATGRFIGFLDSDDSWHPQKLEVQYGYMSMNPDVKLSGHRMKLISESDSKDEVQIDKELIEVQEITKKALLLQNKFVTTSNVMLIRDIPYRFNEAKRYAEDHYLWLEITYAFKVVLIKAELGYAYKAFTGVSGLSSHIFKMYQGSLESFSMLLRENKINTMMYLFLISLRTLRLIKAVIHKYITPKS